MPTRRYSKRQDLSIYYFYDDFLGSSYDDRWWAGRATGSGGTLSASVGSFIVIVAYPSSSYEMYQGDKPDFSVAKNVVHTSRWYESGGLTLAQYKVGLEAASPAHTTDWISFTFDSSVSVNWLTQCVAGGVATTVDTGIAASATSHETCITCTIGKISFLFDGTLVSEITTNITALQLQPFIKVTSSAPSQTRTVYCDWIEVYGERE